MIQIMFVGIKILKIDSEIEWNNKIDLSGDVCYVESVEETD